VGEVADRLESLTVTVSSPDGNIEAQVIGGQPRSLTFRADAYQQYTEPTLAHQLARIATLLFVGRDREVRQIIEDAGLHRVRQPSEAADEAQRRYLEEIRQIHAIGMGPRELVRFEATGMLDWRCDIADGTLRYLSEPEFIGEVMGAAQALLQHHRYETALLRNEHFGSGRAEATRERMRRRTASSH
jgi:hypothetical protein